MANGWIQQENADVEKMSINSDSRPFFTLRAYVSFAQSIRCAEERFLQNERLDVLHFCPRDERGSHIMLRSLTVIPWENILKFPPIPEARCHHCISALDCKMECR